jgi:hypothetical protein
MKPQTMGRCLETMIFEVGFGYEISMLYNINDINIISVHQM